MRRYAAVVWVFGLTSCLEYSAYDTNTCVDGVIEVTDGVLNLGIDDVPRGCSEIDGSVLATSRATTLEALRGISTIRGDLSIIQSGVVDTEPLDSLQRIGGSVLVRGNTSLRDVRFRRLTKVGGDLLFQDNSRLATIDVPVVESEDADSIELTVSGNPTLRSLRGFDLLRRLGRIEISDNDGLLDVPPFTALERVEGGLMLTANASLPDLSAFNRVDSIAGAVVLTRMPELRSLDVLADGPSGVAFLEIHGLGVRACETLTLEARLGLVPGAVNRDGERCFAEFDDSNPEVVATRANFDLTWTLEGVPESFTQHLEWGPDDDFDNAELVSVTSDARVASFVAPPVDTDLRFELEVVWSGGARTAVWHLRSDEDLASLPPTITGPRNLIVAAGFDPHFELVAMDPDGPSPGPVTVIDAPMGNVQRVSETGWVYEAPRGFRGLDTARFEVVSGDRSATHTLTFDVRDAAVIVSDVDGPGVELSDDATYGVYIRGNEVVRRNILRGTQNVVGDSLRFVDPVFPRIDPTAEWVVFSADGGTNRQIFKANLNGGGPVRLTLAQKGEPAPHESGADIRLAQEGGSELGVVSHVSPVDGEMQVFRFPGGTRRTRGGPCTGGAMLTETGVLVVACASTATFLDGSGGIAWIGNDYRRVDQPEYTSVPPPTPGVYPSTSASGGRIAFGSRSNLRVANDPDRRMRVYVNEEGTLLHRDNAGPHLVFADLEHPRDLDISSDGARLGIRTTTALTNADEDTTHDLYLLNLDDLDAGPVLLTTGTSTSVDRPSGVDAFALDATGERVLVSDGSRLFAISIW